MLYHLTDPLKALRAIARSTDRLFLWTHYFDADVCRAIPEHGLRFAGEVELVDGDVRAVGHRYQYLHALRSARFMGGTRSEARWLTRADLLRVLRELGFDQLEVGFEERAHHHGPSIAIAARRTATTTTATA